MFDRKEYNKKYYIRNREKTLKRQKEYIKNNKKKHSDCMKEWYKRNIEYTRIYYRENRDKIRKYQRQYIKIKRKTDLKCNLNGNISRAITYSLKDGKCFRHWEELVGYTLNHLIKHLRKTMPKDYTWKDFLKGNLHIDHIVPISAFNFTKAEHIDFKRCWALNNLRLLPAKENMSKGAKLTKSFQPALKI